MGSVGVSILELLSSMRTKLCRFSFCVSEGLGVGTNPTEVGKAEQKAQMCEWLFGETSLWLLWCYIRENRSCLTSFGGEMKLPSILLPVKAPNNTGLRETFGEASETKSTTRGEQTADGCVTEWSEGWGQPDSKLGLVQLDHNIWAFSSGWEMSPCSAKAMNRWMNSPGTVPIISVFAELACTTHSWK